VLEKEDLW